MPLRSGKIRDTGRSGQGHNLSLPLLPARDRIGLHGRADLPVGRSLSDLRFRSCLSGGRDRVGDLDAWLTPFLGVMGGKTRRG